MQVSGHMPHLNVRAKAPHRKCALVQRSAPQDVTKNSPAWRLERPDKDFRVRIQLWFTRLKETET
jgi:hypothetical protein